MKKFTIIVFACVGLFYIGSTPVVENKRDDTVVMNTVYVPTKDRAVRMTLAAAVTTPALATPGRMTLDARADSTDAPNDAISRSRKETNYDE